MIQNSGQFSSDFPTAQQNSYSNFQTFSFQDDIQPNNNNIINNQKGTINRKATEQEIILSKSSLSTKQIAQQNNQPNQQFVIQELQQKLKSNRKSGPDSLDIDQQIQQNKQQHQVKFAQDFENTQQMRLNNNYNERSQNKYPSFISQNDNKQIQQFQVNQKQQLQQPHKKLLLNLDDVENNENSTSLLSSKSPNTFIGRKLLNDESQDQNMEFSLSMHKGVSQNMVSQDTASVINQIKVLKAQYIQNIQFNNEVDTFKFLKIFQDDLYFLVLKLLESDENRIQFTNTFNDIDESIKYFEKNKKKYKGEQTSDGIQKMQVLQTLVPEFIWLSEQKVAFESSRLQQKKSTTIPQLDRTKKMEQISLLSDQRQLNVFSNKDKFGQSERVDLLNNSSPIENQYLMKKQTPYVQSQFQQQIPQQPFQQSQSSNQSILSQQFSPSKQSNSSSRFSVSSILQKQHSLTTNQSTPTQSDCSKLVSKHFFQKNSNLQIQTEGLSPRLNNSSNYNLNKSSQRSSIVSHRASSIRSGSIVSNLSLNKSLIGLQKPDSLQLFSDSKSSSRCPIIHNNSQYDQLPSSKNKQKFSNTIISPISTRSLSPFSNSSSSKKTFFQPMKNSPIQINYKEVKPFLDPKQRTRDDQQAIDAKLKMGEYYRDFLDLINYSNGLVQPFKIKMHVPIFKVGISTKNNPQLIGEIIKKRWWWKFSDGQMNGWECQLLWSDEKDYNFFKNMKLQKEIAKDNLSSSHKQQQEEQAAQKSPFVRSSITTGNILEDQINKFIGNRDLTHFKEYLKQNDQPFEQPFNIFVHKNNDSCFITNSYKPLILLKNPIIYSMTNQLQENNQLISKKNLIDNLKDYCKERYGSDQMAFSVLPKSFIISKNNEQGALEWRNHKTEEIQRKKAIQKDSSKKFQSSSLWIIKQSASKNWKEYKSISLKLIKKFSLINQNNSLLNYTFPKSFKNNFMRSIESKVNF